MQADKHARCTHQQHGALAAWLQSVRSASRPAALPLLHLPLACRASSSAHAQLLQQ